MPCAQVLPSGASLAISRTCRKGRRTCSGVKSSQVMGISWPSSCVDGRGKGSVFPEICFTLSRPSFFGGYPQGKNKRSVISRSAPRSVGKLWCLGNPGSMVARGRVPVPRRFTLQSRISFREWSYLAAASPGVILDSTPVAATSPLRGVPGPPASSPVGWVFGVVPHQAHL